MGESGCTRAWVAVHHIFIVVECSPMSTLQAEIGIHRVGMGAARFLHLRPDARFRRDAALGYLQTEFTYGRIDVPKPPVLRLWATLVQGYRVPTSLALPPLRQTLAQAQQKNISAVSKSIDSYCGRLLWQLPSALGHDALGGLVTQVARRWVVGYTGDRPPF